MSFNLFVHTKLNLLSYFTLPAVLVSWKFTYYPTGSNFQYYKIVLVNVVHEVFQVGVDACLCVDSGLFICKKVVELHDSYRDSFVLLCTHKHVS